MELTFTAVDERQLGPKWQAAFARAWPGWRTWYLAQGGERRLGDAERQLRRHMPELLPVWQRQVELAGGGRAGRALSHLLEPTGLPRPLLAGGSGGPDGPFLVRNYDLDPDLSEATILRSAWTGRDVVATMEAIAGAADGVNAAGLAVSLAFGGRKVRGTGFGVPLIVRYLLETCERTRDAVEVLRRIPSHMSYNLTLVDRTGDYATAFLAPDRPVEITRRPWATNHQSRIEWAEQARFSRTEERAAAIERLLAEPGMTPERLTEAFLRGTRLRQPAHRGFRHGLHGGLSAGRGRPGAALARRESHGACRALASEKVAGACALGSRARPCHRNSRPCWPSACAVPQRRGLGGLGRFWMNGFPQFAG